MVAGICSCKYLTQVRILGVRISWEISRIIPFACACSPGFRMYCGSNARRDLSVYDALEMMVRVPDGSQPFERSSKYPEISLNKWDQVSKRVRLQDYIEGLGWGGRQCLRTKHGVTPLPVLLTAEFWWPLSTIRLHFGSKVSNDMSEHHKTPWDMTCLSKMRITIKLVLNCTTK